jgi:hypothetical protein
MRIVMVLRHRAAVRRQAANPHRGADALGRRPLLGVLRRGQTSRPMAILNANTSPKLREERKAAENAKAILDTLELMTKAPGVLNAQPGCAVASQAVTAIRASVSGERPRSGRSLGQPTGHRRCTGMEIRARESSPRPALLRSRAHLSVLPRR